MGRRRRSRRFELLFLALLMLGVPPRSVAQGPTIPGPLDDATGSSRANLLGPIPGSGGHLGGDGQADQAPAVGRPGPSVPRVPRGVTTPTGPDFARPQLERGLLEPLGRRGTLPDYGQLIIPPAGTPAGDDGGMTLEQAIPLLLHQNPDLKAKSFDLTQAEADILTASLRANPLFYADSQGVPYGAYTRQSPGVIQYDVNITHPLDLSHKRRARTDSAVRTRQVLEALYRDAVRSRIDDLSSAFVDALVARLRTRIAAINLDGATDLRKWAEDPANASGLSEESKRRLRIQEHKAKLALDKEQDKLDDANDAVAALLGLPVDAGKTLKINGILRVDRPSLPGRDESTSLALSSRPDLIAYRLGLGRAEADVRLARASRFEDVYLLYQPYTYHSNGPGDLRGSYAWALGATVPLPLYNRNQGNIARARSNVAQTRVQLDAAVRQVALEVRQAVEEEQGAWEALTYFEANILGPAEALFNDIKGDYEGEPEGKRPRDEEFFKARAEYNETASQFIDAIVRYRRSLLAVTKAVGCRVAVEPGSPARPPTARPDPPSFSPPPPRAGARGGKPGEGSTWSSRDSRIN